MYRLDLYTNVLDKIIAEHDRLLASYDMTRHWGQMQEEDLWEALCFCILSSSVWFETAKSAVQQLSEKGMLDIREMYGTSAKAIAQELSRPIYLPRRKDGTFRKYRFPRIRAINLIQAFDALYRRNGGIISILRNHSSGKEARNFLTKEVNGLGLKQASHFLRDVKYSNALAIIDTHVIRFLQLLGLIETDCALRLTPQKYMQFEGMILNIAEERNLNPAILDKAVWIYMRRMKG